jgi:CDP-glucose 4,6-dehydratase
LDISKAKAKLKWQPRWELSRALDSIVDWHQSWLSRDNMRKKTIEQIRFFESKAT